VLSIRRVYIGSWIAHIEHHTSHTVHIILYMLSSALHIIYSNKSEVFLHWPPVCTAATATSHILYPGIPIGVEPGTCVNTDNHSTIEQHVVNILPSVVSRS